MITGKHRLTVKKVENAKQHGYLSDGSGLYLKVRKSGSKSWVYIWTKVHKRTEITIGPAGGAQAITLKRARQEAELIRTQIGNGLDPVEERNREEPKTFLECAELLLAELVPTWKSPKTGEQWRKSLLVDCKPLHNKKVNAVTDADCRKVVIPVWKRTPETGLRLRKRLERVLSYAEALGWREGSNPARWQGHFKEALVGADKIPSKHFPAMPYQEVPAFYAELKAKGTIPALALEFTILTAARSKETLGAVWSEIDFDNALWNLPAERMKNGHEHTVPLTDRALEILRYMQNIRQSDYVFPGKKAKKPLSNMTLTMLMRRMGYGDYVPHGFRTSFRSFCGDQTNAPREIAEKALSHLVGSKVEQAYSRGNALDKRRRLMPLWSDYCSGVQSGEIVRLHG